MTHKKFSMPAGNGNFMLHQWEASSNFPYIWIVHGFGEHTARYDEVATFLNAHGFNVAGVDVSGHGLSAAELNNKNFNTVADHVNDLNKIHCDFFNSHTIADPSNWFLFSHSMGGLFSLEWLHNIESGSLISNPQRAFFSAPLIDLKLPIPAWKIIASKQLKVILPELKLSQPVGYDNLSYEDVNSYDYEMDPLNHSNGSPRFLLSILKAVSRLMSKAPTFKTPMAFAKSNEDQLVSPEAIDAFYKHLRCEKKLFTIHNSKHEIFNDLHKNECFEHLVAWYAQAIPAKMINEAAALNL